MQRRILWILLFYCVGIVPALALSNGDSIQIKDLCRLSTTKENALVGYGLVTGLAGTGDSSRTTSTMQSIKNTLRRFQVTVPLEDAHSRNAAAVMVTATLPPYSQIGNKLDINVTSLGDARSLVGGTLLLTHLIGADSKIYALAQGPISVGGYSYDLNGNVVQKNHVTAAQLSGGAIVERSVQMALLDESGNLEYFLNDPNFDTANEIAKTLKERFGEENVWAVDAARVKVFLPESQRKDVVGIISSIGETFVHPEIQARVVINERTGTVVAGSHVRIAPVTITHGDLNVSITTDYSVSQPGLVFRGGQRVSTEVIPHTEIEVNEEMGNFVTLPSQSTIAELVMALNKVQASTRDIITILQGVKRAGALHAELVIQ
jgi:flagellar P-ring protein precursor FlgI